MIEKETLFNEISNFNFSYVLESSEIQNEPNIKTSDRPFPLGRWILNFYSLRMKFFSHEAKGDIFIMYVWEMPRSKAVH